MSLLNRTAGRRRRKNVCVWQTWQGYYLRVLSRSLTKYFCVLILYKKICLEDGEVWRENVPNVIIVTFVTQGLSSPFLCGPVVYVHNCSGGRKGDTHMKACVFPIFHFYFILFFTQQAALTQLIQYYHRFQKILSQHPFKRLPIRSELINIHHVMVEVKKHKTTF